MRAERTQVRRQHLSLLALDLIVSAPKLAGGILRDALQRQRACVISIPGFSNLYNASCQQSLEFFDLPLNRKAAIMGIADSDIARVRKHPCERGWKPSGSSKTGALKEYFQYGLDVDEGQAIPRNTWPEWDGLGAFRFAKTAVLDAFVGAHLALFRALESDAAMLRLEHFYSWPANILCRDTHYIAPSQASIGAGAAFWSTPHVDLAELTLLKPERGLELYLGSSADPGEVNSATANWARVEHDSFSEDELLCIGGLAMEIRSGGRVRATWHRVIRDSLGDRYSIVSFGNAGVVDVLSAPKTREETGFNRYESISRPSLADIGSEEYLKLCRLVNTSVARKW